jgi:hypothetical protein
MGDAVVVDVAKPSCIAPRQRQLVRDSRCHAYELLHNVSGRGRALPAKGSHEILTRAIDRREFPASPRHLAYDGGHCVTRAKR